MSYPTWTDQHLPVLRAAVELCDEQNGTASETDIAKRLGVDDETVQVALRALLAEDPPFFVKADRRFVGGYERVWQPTGHARRALRQWPNPEARLDEIIKVLQLAAEREPDPEKRSAMQKVITAATGVSRDLFISVVSGMITGS
ncbi:hypothetical protein [Micromonospora chersina]|uniref:hypothetical protein n=1 Tax=Micromonospora chersina TaxID=47854 RepID=UPI0036C1F7BF